MQQIADLTNPYIQHEAGQIELVPIGDRIYGMGAGLIMAAFAFPGGPSRFCDGLTGTYYAASDLETAIAETRYHAELIMAGTEPCVTEKSVIHAGLGATLVDVRDGLPCPPDVYHPTDYTAGQEFGAMVRHLEGYGIVYNSVRRPEGDCAAIFRPPALSGAQVIRTLLYTWDGHHIANVR